MKKMIPLLVVAGIAGITITGCTNKDAAKNPDASPASIVETTSSPEPMADKPMAAEAGVMVGGANMVPSKDIVENAINSSDHTTLVAAVQAAGLVETLQAEGPFTVFAPTNAAFDKLPEGTVDTLLMPENKDMLTAVLTYHVVPGALTASDLADGQSLTTVQGQDLTVMMEGESVYLVDVNGSKSMVTIPNVISSNGVTHVVDTVLQPAN